MPSSKPKRGWILPIHVPAWGPLRNLAPDHVDGFMWMHEVELEDGKRLHAYKHHETRRYLHLDHDGRAFVFVGSGDREQGLRYEEADPERLLDLALARPDKRAKLFRQNLSAEFKRLRWARSATKHRISKQRIRHVLENCLRILREDPPPGNPRAKELRLIFLGKDPAGVALEVIAVETDEEKLLVIHAMELRPRYRGAYEEVKR